MKNPKKEVMREVAKLIRSILKWNGYDPDGRVRLYRDLSVECLCYGKQNIRDCVVDGLLKYPNFKTDSIGYSWVDGKYKIYLTII